MRNCIKDIQHIPCNTSLVKDKTSLVLVGDNRNPADSIDPKKPSKAPNC